MMRLIVKKNKTSLIWNEARNMQQIRDDNKQFVLLICGFYEFKSFKRSQIFA